MEGANLEGEGLCVVCDGSSPDRSSVNGLDFAWLVQLLNGDVEVVHGVLINEIPRRIGVS